MNEDWLKMDTQLLSQHEGKVKNPFHYLVELSYPEYSQIPCTKHRYISSVHLQYYNTYITSPETGKLSEPYKNCICNMGAQGDITVSQKQRSFCQQSSQSPPPTSKAAQTTSPFMPKQISSSLPSFIYFSFYG